jgi:hypothetical protein
MKEESPRPAQRVEDLLTSHEDSKGPALQGTSLRLTQEPAQDHNILLLYPL